MELSDEILDKYFGKDESSGKTCSCEKCEIRHRIEQNEELRKIIIDLADLWDGKESERYGRILSKVLFGLGINDIPEFYKKDNINKVIDEMTEKRDERKGKI